MITLKIRNVKRKSFLLLLQMSRLSVGQELFHIGLKQILSQHTILIKPKSECGRVLLVSGLLALNIAW
jgi:nitrate reductase gamma subunit